ncbi:MAG: hypothetical protein K0R38_6450 [Polyangiaceae bacterium]|jgi:hypothetical protein|nr:hypothetical protein [Polyangiaceae bacterium]
MLDGSPGCEARPGTARTAAALGLPLSYCAYDEVVAAPL